MTLFLAFVSYAIALSVALGWAGHRSRERERFVESRVRPIRVLVIGATGRTGRHLVERALAKGLTVTAFARDPSRVSAEHPGLRVVRGDVLEVESVEAAMHGQDAVLCALGHKRYFPPNRILSEGTRNILRAMERHAVGRLVCETSLGIGDGAGRMGLWYTFFVIPLILPFYFWDKTRQERIIASSAVQWVIVRPGVLTDGEPRGRVRHGRGVGSFLRTVRIPRADVAEFMLDQLESDAYVGSASGVCA